jgi:hypothetical protein
MPWDVQAQRVIPLPPERVAAYAMDWRHDHEWTQATRRAMLTAPAVGGDFGVGAEVTRTASFLGRQFDYVLRVVGYDPPTLLDMRTVTGPLPVHLTYRFDPHPDGTLASIRIRATAGPYERLAAPLVAGKVRASIRRDLRDLHHHLIRIR